MRLSTLIKRAKDSGRHKVLHESDTSIVLKRNFEPNWTIVLKDGLFKCAYKDMVKSTKITSIQVLANYLNLN